VKVARTVLRGPGASNVPRLPDSWLELRESVSNLLKVESECAILKMTISTKMRKPVPPTRAYPHRWREKRSTAAGPE
jgi:hypothetical protein